MLRMDLASDWGVCEVCLVFFTGLWIRPKISDWLCLIPALFVCSLGTSLAKHRIERTYSFRTLLLLL